MTILQNIKYQVFKLKQKLYGEHYWVGPSTEIGVCDECADHTPGPYELQKKIPVRRLIPEDNIYLCKNHWESARQNPDCVPLEPFLRLEN